jgi:hypothetical protein
MREDLSDFPQSLQADVGVVAQIMHFRLVVARDIYVNIRFFSVIHVGPHYC